MTLAELGDKTQLMIMAFATRFPWATVMFGVLLGVIANHLIAALAGIYLGNFIDPEAMKLAASLAFIAFGLWSLREDGDEGGVETGAVKFHPILTVALGFFLAEMGDKTQLVAMTLAAKFRNLVPVLCGSTLGMLVADGLGIVAGCALYRVLPEKSIRYIAAALFILCGLCGLYGWYVG